MKFEQFIENEIPNWRELISDEDLLKLKNIYDKANECKQTLENIIDMSFKHASAGVDYSPDYEKTNERWLTFRNLLAQKLEEVKHAIKNYDKLEIEGKTR